MARCEAAEALSLDFLIPKVGEPCFFLILGMAFELASETQLISYYGNPQNLRAVTMSVL